MTAAPLRRCGIGTWLAWALAPVVVVLLWVAYKPIERNAAAMRYPFQLDREEAFLLDQSMRLARMETIYPRLDDYPYTVGNYPPVYPATWAGMLAVAPPSLPIGRALVLLSVLVIAASLAGIVMRETGRAMPALLSVGLFMATWDVNDWIAYARVDLPAIAFGMAGLAAATSVARRRAGLWIGVALFAVAFFTKQTQVIAPAALLLGLVASGQRLRAGWLAAGTALAIAFPFAALNIATGGEFFRHLVVYNANVMHWDQIAIWIRHLWFFGRFKFVALALLALPLLAARVRKPWRLPPATGAPETMTATIAYVVLSGLSIVSVAKAGSACNYLLEFHAACALFAGLAAGRLANLANDGALPFRRPLVAAAVAAFLAMALHAADFVSIGSRASLFQPGPPDAQSDVLRIVQLAVQETDGDVLCEEPIYAILAGKPVLYQPFIMSQLAREGKWDETPFVDDLLRARFGIVVTTQDLSRRDVPLPGFTEGMRDAILKVYKLSRSVGGTYLYIPAESRRRMPEPKVASAH